VPSCFLEILGELASETPFFLLSSCGSTSPVLRIYRLPVLHQESFSASPPASTIVSGTRGGAGGVKPRAGTANPDVIMELPVMITRYDANDLSAPHNLN
jgi:hypothetical protein